MEAPIFSVSLPAEEAERRRDRCLELLARLSPRATGLLLFDQTTVYYFSGVMAAGLIWLPREGEPVLLIRRGLERAREESPLRHVVPFRSYSELPDICARYGSPLGGEVAVDKGGLLWSQAEMLQSRLPGLTFVAGDGVVKRTRVRKSLWELAYMREGGRRQHHCVYEEFPKKIHAGLTEWEIARRLLDCYLDHGHATMTRLAAPGRVSIGSVSAGISGLCVSAFDGPLGLRGQHAASPNMGSRSVCWEENQILTVDVPFCYEGYCADKTQSYWSGEIVPAHVQRAHDACRAIQRKTSQAMVPGATPAQIWNMAKEMAAEAGYAETFMGMGPERSRFLGHGIGLEMNEFPPVADRFAEPLEEGVVLALEPKIALPGQGMVGVENTFCVTPVGGASLTGGEFDLLRVY